MSDHAPVPEIVPVDVAPVEIAPVDVDGVGAVAVGTAIWAVALVATLLLRETLAGSGREWWIGVCACGFGLGLLGLPYVIHRRTVYRRHASGATSS